MDDVSFEELVEDEDAVLVDFAGDGSSSFSRKSKRLPPPETMLGFGGANSGVMGVGAGAVAENDELTEVVAGVDRTLREAEAVDEGRGLNDEEAIGVLNEVIGVPNELEGIGALRGAPKLEEAIGAPIEEDGVEEASSFPLSST